MMHCIRFWLGSAQTKLEELTTLPQTSCWIFRESYFLGEKGNKKKKSKKKGKIGKKEKRGK